MNPAEVSNCPTFEEAVVRFQAFLRKHDWTTTIVWIKGDNQFDERLQAEEAKHEYESARQRGLGVCLHGVLLTDDFSFAIVEYPLDADEAERLLFPPDGGLKVSLVVWS